MTYLRITIRSSTMLALGLCAAHLGAGVAVWLAAVPLWLKMGLSLGIVASLGWPLASQAALRAAEAIVAVEITESGRLAFLTRRGKWRGCELLGSTYVSPWLTILNLKPEGGRFVRHVVLVPDNVDARDFRRLRTWLRWGGRPGANRVY
jgi:toxin CptA